MWLAQTLGDPNGKLWEISVVREDNDLGRRSLGWFNDQKLLISHSGSPCRWPLAPGLGPIMVEIANRYCDFLNRGGNAEDVQQFQLADSLRGISHINKRGID